MTQSAYGVGTVPHAMPPQNVRGALTELHEADAKLQCARRVRETFHAYMQALGEWRVDGNLIDDHYGTGFEDTSDKLTDAAEERLTEIDCVIRQCERERLAAVREIEEP